MPVMSKLKPGYSTNSEPKVKPIMLKRLQYDIYVINSL